MNKVAGWILIVVLQVVYGVSALAEIGTFETDVAVFHGVLEDGVPAGLGYSVYDDGSLVVGIFDSHCEPNGFAVHVGASSYFYDALSAGFFSAGFSSLYGCMNYTDINGNHIAIGTNAVRGSTELCYGTMQYDAGVYYGEMDLDQASPLGYGIMQWSNGSYSAGVWINGMLQGYAAFVNADGSGYMGYFVNNVLNGYVYGYLQDGTCYLYRFLEGALVEVCNGGDSISPEYTHMAPEDLAAYYAQFADPQNYAWDYGSTTTDIFNDPYYGLYPDGSTDDYAYSHQESICVACYGSGSCSVCHGTGTYSNYGFSDTCSACNGTGTCSICDGKGSY